MKITLAAGLYPPEMGGPATYAAMLESELPDRGITINTVPFGWVRHYPKIIRHCVYAWKLWQASKDTDVIYALDPISVGVPALLIARLRRQPFVIRLGGDYAWEQGRVRFGLTDVLDDYLENKTERPLPVKILAWLQSFVVRRAVKVVAPSKYLKSVIEKWGVQAERIQVIYSALYPLEITGSRESLRAQLNFANPTIVSVGRLVPWKGFEVLIDVISELRAAYPEISLVIAGDGEERALLEAKVAKLNLAEHVRFAGRLSKTALGATIRAADIFVLNTAYEGLSHQIIEVMDIGTPVITTKAGGNPELITNGVNGFLVEYNNKTEIKEAIAQVLNHPESRERMTQSARLRSKEFNKSVVVTDIEAVLKELHAQSAT